jgi:AcrR family transcriptional regulator
MTGGGVADDAHTAAKRPRRRDREVLEAATKVFYERGYSDATVQDVADELGILKGSVYHYIKTKEDLLFRLLEQAHEDVELILHSAAARDDLSPLDRLFLYVRGQVEFNLANFPRVSVYYRDVGQLSDQRLRDILRRRKAHETWVVEMIREAQRDGRVDVSLEPALLANCLFGTMIWLYRWYRPDGIATPARVIDHVARYAIAGVVGAGATTATPAPS